MQIRGEKGEIEDHAHVRGRWPRWLADRFTQSRHVSVWAAGTVDALSVVVHSAAGAKSFGSNRPAMPVRFGISKSWSDTVTYRVDQDPFVEINLLARVWVASEARAHALQAALTDTYWQRNQRDGVPLLRKGFVDLAGYEARLDLEGNMLDIAQLFVIEAWTDDGLVERLTREHHHERRKQTRVAGR